MTKEALATELGLSEDESAEVVLRAYEKVCEVCRATAAGSSDKNERRMAKMKLRELETDLGPAVQKVNAIVQVEARLQDVIQVLKDGFGSPKIYFEEIDKWLPQCDSKSLELKVRSIKDAFNNPPGASPEVPSPNSTSEKEEHENEVAASEEAAPDSASGVSDGSLAKAEKELLKKPDVEVSSREDPPVTVPPVEEKIAQEESPGRIETILPVGEAVTIEKARVENVEVVDPTKSSYLVNTILAGRFAGQTFERIISGAKTRIILNGSIVFGREGAAGIDVELPLLVHAIPKEKLKTYRMSISRRHFQIQKSATDIHLYDGAFDESGERKKSAGGVFVDGVKVDAFRLNEKKSGNFTIINPEVIPERPAFRFTNIEAEKIDETLSKSFVSSGDIVAENNSLLLERIEGYSERILCLWGPCSAQIFGSKLAEYVLIPSTCGLYVWSQATGILPVDEAVSLLDG